MNKYVSRDNRINEFSLSFDETRIAYSEIDLYRTSSVVVVDPNIGNTVKVFSSDTSMCYYPQILFDEKRVMFIEVSNQNNRNIKIRIINTDSLNTITTVNINPILYWHYFELSSDDKIIIENTDSLGYYELVNLDNEKVIQLKFTSVSGPFFTKDYMHVIYFTPDWDLRYLSLDDLTDQSIISCGSLGGSFHSPKASKNNNDLIFINLKSIQVPF